MTKAKKDLIEQEQLEAIVRIVAKILRENIQSLLKQQREEIGKQLKRTILFQEKLALSNTPRGDWPSVLRSFIRNYLKQND